MISSWQSTGMPHLDQVLNGLKAGDNVVWQTDSVEDFKIFTVPFAENALKHNRKVVYIRFAVHPPAAPPDGKIKVYEVDTAAGFESFTKKIHSIIAAEGPKVCYIFDSLSELLSAWATDFMIGNFFSVTCPYLFELDTIAYFAILRHRHSHRTIARIRETTQLLIDLYSCGGSLYVHPLKVLDRYSATMFLPHVKQNDNFVPLTKSSETADLFTHICSHGANSVRRNLDYWDQMFLDAEQLKTHDKSSGERKRAVERICSTMITRDARMAELAREFIGLDELLDLKTKLIGTGFIGGKSTGMLISRSILMSDKDTNWNEYLEPHDSYYIGSDVFYTYVVHNNRWKLFMRQKTDEGYFAAAHELKEKLLSGRFPDEIKEQFYQMIEYFGQSPIIVRSSSLLEDGYGNAFAGKYESFFLGNQGSPDERYAEFENAVRKVYASALNEDALVYRRQRGLDKLDEHMALLVQRVSGDYHDKYFFPDMAGVGVSRNIFVWNSSMDSKAGMLRLVAGLGTRAVNRSENDYPRLAALDNPLLRPDTDIEGIRAFSQHNADVINIESNQLETVPAQSVFSLMNYASRRLTGTRDYKVENDIKNSAGSKRKVWLTTFDELLSGTDFAKLMQSMLKKLEETYKYPVEVEFTVNFKEDGSFQINLLQCRPFQAKGITGKKIEMPQDIPQDRILFRTSGNFMGGSIAQPIEHVIYIDPKKYIELPLQKKYDIARLIGVLNKKIENRQDHPVMLAGPGRWGTTTPSLGIPVSFSEINNMTALIEIGFSEGNLMPELSYGTHFFHDLVETDIFYAALFQRKQEKPFNITVLTPQENRLPKLAPEYKAYKDTVKVYSTNQKQLTLLADISAQQTLCLTTP